MMASTLNGLIFTTSNYVRLAHYLKQRSLSCLVYSIHARCIGGFFWERGELLEKLPTFIGYFYETGISYREY